MVHKVDLKTDCHLYILIHVINIIWCLCLAGILRGRVRLLLLTCTLQLDSHVPHPIGEPDITIDFLFLKISISAPISGRNQHPQ